MVHPLAAHDFVSVEANNPASAITLGTTTADKLEWLTIRSKQPIYVLHSTCYGFWVVHFTSCIAPNSLENCAVGSISVFDRKRICVEDKLEKFKSLHRETSLFKPRQINRAKKIDSIKSSLKTTRRSCSAYIDYSVNELERIQATTCLVIKSGANKV